MKRAGKKFTLVLIVLTGSLVVTLISHAGDLEPSTAPAPTMKTLDEVEARIPIPGSDTPEGAFTISQSGSYYLTGNRNCTNTGIYMFARSHVTIDLNGYSLIGAGTTSGSGVNLAGECHNIEIKNGTIQSFGSGGIVVQIASSRMIKATNVHVEDNGQYINASGIILLGYGAIVKGCTAVNNSGDGIRTGSNSSVSDCSASDNALNGIVTDNGSRVFGCVAYGNTTRGINTDVGSTVLNCSAYQNGDDGIATTGKTVISNCSSSYNGDVGMWVGSESVVENCVVSFNNAAGMFVNGGCTIRDNSATYNGQDGSSAGIRVIGLGSRIESNHAASNTKGISIQYTPNFVFRNTAYGNTSSDFDGVNTALITTDPTLAGPWHNMKF